MALLLQRHSSTIDAFAEVVAKGIRSMFLYIVSAIGIFQIEPLSPVHLVVVKTDFAM